MGKQLNIIHRYNAWVVIVLAVTGVLLYFPQLRGVLAPVRVPLKDFHIGIGVISTVILISYLPYIGRHWRTLKREALRRSTIVMALFLLVGWILSGVVLWWDSSFPAGWSSPSLLLHDLLTWVGIPWIIGHSILSTRRQKARREAAKAAAIAKHSPLPAIEPLSAVDSSFGWDSGTYGRRSFLKMGLVAATVVGLGVPAYKYLKQMTDTGGSDISQFAANDGNQMMPVPTADAQSVVPIGGGLQGQFRVYTVTEIPKFTNANWSFTVKGLVDTPLQLNWEQFLQMKRSVQVSDFHCVTGWNVNHITWEGIPLGELLNKVGVKSNAKFVKFYSGDRVYTDALSLEQAHMKDVMVAVLMDGKPIPQELGGPVRLIVPKMYAYKSVKWLVGIELIDKPHTGYWENLGYSNDAWVNGI